MPVEDEEVWTVRPSGDAHVVGVATLQACARTPLWPAAQSLLLKTAMYLTPDGALVSVVQVVPSQLLIVVSPLAQ